MPEDPSDEIPPASRRLYSEIDNSALYVVLSESDSHRRYIAHGHIFRSVPDIPREVSDFIIDEVLINGTEERLQEIFERKEKMMQRNLIGDKITFAIEYTFCDDSHDTEIALYVEGINILAFDRNGESYTTRWNIDELAIWLRKFIDEMAEDPYPVDCEGAFAAQKDDAAREYDSDDDELFEKYYQQLYDWNLRHRWHSASSGAVLADVYFQLVGSNVEISWDNRDVDEGVTFKSITGGAKVPLETFHSVVTAFLTEYALHWFN